MEQQYETQAIQPVSIADFLLEDASQLLEKKEITFEQFKVPFILQSLDAETFDSLRRKATRKVRNHKGQYMQETDSDLLSDLLIEASVIQPDLQNAQLQEYYGTVGKPSATLRKMLKAGQYADLSTIIQELNGFEAESVDELEDTVKK